MSNLVVIISVKKVMSLNNIWRKNRTWEIHNVKVSYTTGVYTVQHSFHTMLDNTYTYTPSRIASQYRNTQDTIQNVAGTSIGITRDILNYTSIDYVSWCLKKKTIIWLCIGIAHRSKHNTRHHTALWVLPYALLLLLLFDLYTIDRVKAFP